MDKCPTCQKYFPRKYRKKGIKKIYCSLDCKRKVFPIEIRKCKRCKKEIKIYNLGVSKKDPNYCSLSCSKRLTCQLCNKPIEQKYLTHQANSKNGCRRFCSRKCGNVANKALRAKKSYVARGFANAIINLGKLACEVCGFDKPVSLIVHHKDRDRNNNHPENLVTLCGNCHLAEHFDENGKNRTRYIQIAYFIVNHLKEIPDPNLFHKR